VGATAEEAADTVEPQVTGHNAAASDFPRTKPGSRERGRAPIHPVSHRATTRNPRRRARGEASSGKSSGKSGDWSREP
jgi:hypothetical protein